MLKQKRYGPYSLGILILVGVFANQAFAEVTDIQTNEKIFLKESIIEFSGTVENESTGLVTIVIRDHNEEFVLLTQATINHDDTFEKSVKIDDRFTEYETYSSTGFILNMTKGVTTKFDVSINGESISHNEELEKEIEKFENESNIGDSNYDKKIINEQNTNPDFVDSNKDPTYYIERYYSEPTYKSWFDRNYPNLTIEDAVGYSEDTKGIQSTVQGIIEKEIIPEAQASSINGHVKTTTDGSDIAQISLAIAGLGILFGAVYGVKRQVDSNSKQISINKDTIRKKIIKPIIGTTPHDILEIRLAKGEITLDEFDILEKKLK